VDRKREGTLTGTRAEDGGAIAAAGVDEDLPSLDRLGGGKPIHEARKSVVGDREQDQVGGSDDVGRSCERHPRQQFRDAPSAGIGNSGSRDDGMAGAGQRGAEDAAHPAGADNPDSKPRRACGHAIVERLPPLLVHVAFQPIVEVPDASERIAQADRSRS
jgi:hypothetical protein